MADPERQNARHSLPRLDPPDRDFGKSRGRPIDRWYIHDFLWARRDDVHGRVMDVADSGVRRPLR